jgi:aspartate kinase
VSFNNIKVLKFGGTSVKSAARMEHVAKIVAEKTATSPCLVVVSAMGDTTDYLLKLAMQCAPIPDKRELDLLLSTGEQISIALLALTLGNLGIKARSFTGQQVGIFTEAVHNKARIVDIKTDRLQEALSQQQAVIVAGFQGVTPDGEITTLGRGGSDTTAVALAAALNASECDIYTDVDGIFTGDPNKISQARLLPRVSYAEVLEMARLGAQVIHPRAVELARRYEISLRVRNTFKPEHEGTQIDKHGASRKRQACISVSHPGATAEDDMEISSTISGVAVDKEQACVAIMDVPDQPGTAAKIMLALSQANIVVDMIMQSFHPSIGSNNITFTVGETDLNETIVLLNRLKDELNAKTVVSDTDIAKVSLIGLGLAFDPKIPAKLFAACGDAGINIKMISSSEMKITCVVSRADADRAANLIHDAFDLGKAAVTSSK